MKLLSTFKITKGFAAWLRMYKDIEPDLNKLGIKILWAGTNSDESKVYDVTEVKDPSKFEVLTKRKDITKKRTDAGVELESQEVIDTIAKDYVLPCLEKGRVPSKDGYICSCGHALL
tara:strand:+ start:246 stop:596 length:351 start_codon:yes stop_codon:yes gene_type:complete